MNGKKNDYIHTDDVLVEMHKEFKLARLMGWTFDSDTSWLSPDGSQYDVMPDTFKEVLQEARDDNTNATI